VQVDLQALQEFVRVYEERSLSAAAQDLYVSRQSLSRSIRQLEGRLGQLFEREARGVSPTMLAQSIYPHALKALEEAELIEAEARRFSRELVGAVSLSLESNAVMTLPIDFLERYRADRPKIVVSSRALPAKAAREEFISGRCDALIAGPIEGVPYEPISSSTVRIVLSDAFFPAGLPADLIVGPAPGASGAMELDACALEGGEIFCVEPDNAVERALDGFLRHRGVHAELSYRYPDTALAAQAMEAGLGGAVVECGSAIDHFGGAGYAHVIFDGPDAPTWEVGVSFHPDDASACVAVDLARYVRDMVGMGGQADRRNI
jgi:DNA-binding transcriptional LysR family regulator